MIEVDLELDNTPRFIDFYGENHVNGNRSEEKYGIRFECKFDEDFSEKLANSINDWKIPYEYYSLTCLIYVEILITLIHRREKVTIVYTEIKLEMTNSTLFSIKEK